MVEYVGSAGGDVINVLVVTSAFAAVLSYQKIIARYVHSLGTEAALPRFLGRRHPEHGSPYAASLALTAVFAVGVLLSSQGDPALTCGWMAGAGGFPLLVLMLPTSVSVVRYFRKHPTATQRPRSGTLVAPVLAMIALGVAVYLSAVDSVPLTGGVTTTAVVLQVVMWGVFASGLAVASCCRARKPDTDARIGRQRRGSRGD